MPFTEDLSVYFNKNLGAVDATVNGSTVTGIFDKEYVDIDAGGVPVSGYMPVFRCAESDVAGVAKGWDVVVNSVNYKIVIPKKDGTGVIDLVLEKQ